MSKFTGVSAGFLQALVALSFFTLVGLTLLRWGWRGRRVGDHPYCRRCGFDLFGMVPDGKVCSECGADLNQRRAVVTGHRVRRKRLIVFGAVLILSSLVGIGVVVSEVTDRYRLMQLKPDWWLALESKSASPSTRDAAIYELQVRMSSGMLSEGRSASLVKYGLELQRDPSRQWVPAWGDFIVSAHDNGIASNKQWERYTQQAFEPILVVRERVRQGDPLPFRLKLNNARVGKRSLNLSATNHRVNVAGLEIPLSASSYTMVPATDQFIVSPLRHDRFLSGLEPGAQIVRITMNLTLGPQNAGELGPEWTVEAPWMLLPSDQQTIGWIDDPSLRAQVERAMSVPAIDEENQQGSFRIVLSAGTLPASIGYDVIVASGVKQWSLGRFAASRSNSGFGRSYFFKAPDLNTRKADIILRPSLSAAAETVDVFEIWNGEVILKDIPVNYRSPTTKPR